MKTNKLLTLGIFLIIFLLYFLLDDLLNIHIYIPCPFHFITGLYCPGCGVTRMIYAIFRLDFSKAFQYNPLLFISIPFDLVLFINYCYSLLFNKKSYIEKIPQKVWYFLIIIFLIYGILRNIFSGLGPISS